MSLCAAGAIREAADGEPDAEHQHEASEGDAQVRAEAHQDDAVHLWHLPPHLHAGRRRQNGR